MGAIVMRCYELVDSGRADVVVTVRQLKDISRNVMKRESFDLYETLGYALDMLGRSDCKVEVRLD